MNARLGLVAVVAASVTGCLSKPDRPSLGATDAGGDGSSVDAAVMLVPRKIATAYFSSTGFSSNGMSATQYAVPTAGIQNGDLILFIANIDNGSTTVWPLPSASFHQIAQRYFGSDGQTYVASWKIANGEPTVYTGTYGQGIGSAAAAITLIAIAGADPVNPINASAVENGTSGEMPVVSVSSGVTTTVPDALLIWAGGADWLGQNATATFATPDGYTKLAAFGDNGDSNFAWTTLMIASRTQASPGATGTVSGTTTSTLNGIPWGMMLAIAPAR
jgi:hypothetical protein